MALELEKHLVLNKYFLNLFGAKDFDALRTLLNKVEYERGPNGHTSFYNILYLNLPGHLKKTWRDKLSRYDDHIIEYEDRLNTNRNLPNFHLKYFQYLAVLFTEIFLENVFERREAFLRELNEFLADFNRRNGTEIEDFTEADLRKLAFWMATGSGKTLLMHIHYWQIRRYVKDWDNIILITPNEGLSKQHAEELRLSGIPAKIYDGNPDHIKTAPGEVFVVDIFKIVPQKKGSGVTIPTEYFDGMNLVFIDEGHKGAGSTDAEGWKKRQEEIAKEGHTFEYSATFGQIIEFEGRANARGFKKPKADYKNIYNDYVKSILFDYSYKYFYTDGYGKDFEIYNISNDRFTDEQRNLLMTAGLLTYYEQLLIYEEKRDALKEYNVEKPLWVFVGNTVIQKKSNNFNKDEKATASDVKKIVEFLSHILEDKNYLENAIQKILSGKTGLMDREGNDYFARENILKYLKNSGLSPGTIAENIYQSVFHGKGTLQLREIKNADGEIGLRTSQGDRYFGVINIGDVKALKKLMPENLIGHDEHFEGSLFQQIEGANSPVNVLIGAKKFIEGWNSWRVSTMGLINTGKKKGPQIIQLFGRGVRLKGKNYSLKRETENPDYFIKALQTLYIFGIESNYITAFLQALAKNEDVDFRELAVPVTYNHENEWNKKIYTVTKDATFDFTDYLLPLEKDDEILRRITLDLRPRIDVTHGLKSQRAEVEDEDARSVVMAAENDLMIDWQDIYTKLLQYKIEKGFYNLIIPGVEMLKKLIYEGGYRLYVPKTEYFLKEDDKLYVKEKKGVEKLQEIIELILRNYIQRYYNKKEKQKTMHYLDAEPLVKDTHSNMFPAENTIYVKVPKEVSDNIKEVLKTLQYYLEQKEIPELWKNWADRGNQSFFAHFDRHLYTPLIVWKKGQDKITSFPVKLNQGETKFVSDLHHYLTTKAWKFINKEVYLLRNLSKQGVGFFINAGFYPDFMLWIREKDQTGREKQYLTFIDPKGIRNTYNFNDDKIHFCTEDIKKIEKTIQEKMKNRHEPVDLYLNSFIISVTPYDEIKTNFGEGMEPVEEEEFNRHHIFFQSQDDEYIQKLFNKIL